MLADWQFLLTFFAVMFLGSIYSLFVAARRREFYASWTIGFYTRKYVVTQKEHPGLFSAFIVFMIVMTAGSAIAIAIILSAHS